MNSEWKTAEIGSFAKLRSGYSFKSADWRECGTSVIKIANVKAGRIVPEGCGFVDDGVAEAAKEWFTKPGDVLIAMTGYVGEIARVHRKERYLINQRVGRFEFASDSEVDPTFFSYVLQQSDLRGQMERIARGSAQPNLSSADAHKLRIPIPPRRTQAEIAATLTSLDDRIDLLRETNATLEAIAQALFKSWFIDFDPVHAKRQGIAPAGMDEAAAALFPDSFEDSALGSTPAGWRVGTLEDLLVLQRGFDLPSQDRVPGKYPIIAASGPSGTHEVPMAKGPGVVTGRSGVLGRVFLELEDYWPLNTTLWVKEFRGASPCYAYELLRLLDFQSFNAGSAVPTLNRNHVHNLKYLIPSKNCVDAYEAIAIHLQTRSRLNGRQAQILATLRDTLLPRLISGQLRLPDALDVEREVIA
jgi:type I restriction enzyme, S subunit